MTTSLVDKPEPVTVRQADRPCSVCGSWYRKGNDCNKCGEHEPVPESFYVDQGYSVANRPPKGRIWDSKAHKYKK
jgi:ribosomal protein S14